GNLPARRVCADIRAPGPLSVDDGPDVHVVGGRVEPNDVARAVVVEVADAADLVTGRMRPGTDARRPLAVCELPDVSVVGARIEPEDVAGAVLVEVTDAGHLITRRMGPDAGRTR